MELPIFKLEKLKIQAFGDAKRTKELKTFEAQFNPSEIKRSYGIAWAKSAVVNADAKEQRYSFSDPGELSIKLTFDGTGADSYGVMVPRAKTVQARVDELLAATYKYQSDIHQPAWLTLSWGSQEAFKCRLESADVTYTLFERGGAPLRAEVTAKFVADTTMEDMAKEQQKSSPDLSHARAVRSGDTLPLMTQAIYGSSQRYLDVARYNGLDDFRMLRPGQILLFPPLAVFVSGAGNPPERG